MCDYMGQDPKHNVIPTHSLPEEALLKLFLLFSDERSLKDRFDLEINPKDAKTWEIKDGDFVRMSSRRGSIDIKVRITDMSPVGTVFTSFSFASVPVNVLTGSGYDPVTETAELKVCAVKIELVK